MTVESLRSDVVRCFRGAAAEEERAGGEQLEKSATAAFPRVLRKKRRSDISKILTRYSCLLAIFERLFEVLAD